MNFDFSSRAYPKDCQHFNSWGEFIEWCESHQEPANQGVCAKVRASLTHESSNRWDDNLGLNGALEMAHAGWAEGMAQAEQISKPLVETIVGQLERSDVVYDNEGIAVDIGRFLAEDPECWLRFENEIISSPTASPKLITILHNCTESWKVESDAIIRKGAHVMALIQALEYAGHRVELTVVPFSVNEGCCSVTVKQFDQPLDAALTIFALAHPSVPRRLGFIHAENMSRGAQKAIGACYGRVANPESDADIKVHSRVGAIDLDWIIRELEKQGVTLKG